MKGEIKKIKYKHYRKPDCKWVDCNNIIRYSRKCNWFSYPKFDVKPSPKGGKTECVLILDSGEEITGVAYCSMKDNFNYKRGREIAYGRAMKQYQMRYEKESGVIV